MSVCSIHALRHSSPRLKTIAASSRAMVGEERKVEGRTGWEGGGLNTSLGERSDTFNELAFRLSRNLQKKTYISSVSIHPQSVLGRCVALSPPTSPPRLVDYYCGHFDAFWFFSSLRLTVQNTPASFFPMFIIFSSMSPERGCFAGETYSMDCYGAQPRPCVTPGTSNDPRS
jgi:hypothetical protein